MGLLGYGAMGRRTRCWVWTAGRTPKGYAKFWISSRAYRLAHVWLWEQENGPVPDGLELTICAGIGHVFARSTWNQ